MIVRKIHCVGFLALLVPFGREDAAATDALEAKAESANSGKQVDETKPEGNILSGEPAIGCLAQRIHRKPHQQAFAAFIAVNGSPGRP